MMNNFNFYKKNESTFNKENALDKVLIPDLVNDNIPIIDRPQTGYEDPRWIEKSDYIKGRDNYTCQLCHAFNPMLSDFVIVEHGEYEAWHRYTWKGNSRYEIYVKDYILNIYFDFLPDYHLSMPRLNVHHKIYFKNRDLWDYDDDCLVTLCEDCHHYVHSLKDIGIPIAEKTRDGKTIVVGETRRKTYIPKIDHTDLGTFRPLSLVKENRWGDGLKGKDLSDFQIAKNQNKKWYDYQQKLGDKIVQISFFVSEDPNWNKHTKEETREAANFIINDFIENFLGYVRQ